MISWLIARVTGPWMFPLIAAAALGLFSWGSLQTVRLSGAHRDLATAREKEADVRAQWAEQVAVMSQAAAASQADFRAKEQQYIMQVQKGYSDVEALKVKNDAVLASVQSQLDGVRGTLAAYAAGTASGGAASADTLAACQHRADALGNVLAESLRVQAELANDAESESGKVAGLLDSWPTGQVKQP